MELLAAPVQTSMWEVLISDPPRLNLKFLVPGPAKGFWQAFPGLILILLM